jgi:hypothetical protein
VTLNFTETGGKSYCVVFISLQLNGKNLVNESYEYSSLVYK